MVIYSNESYFRSLSVTVIPCGVTLKLTVVNFLAASSDDSCSTVRCIALGPVSISTSQRPRYMSEPAARRKYTPLSPTLNIRWLFRVKHMILKLWSSAEVLGNRRCSSVRNIDTLFGDLFGSVRKIIGQFKETIYHKNIYHKNRFFAMFPEIKGYGTIQLSLQKYSKYYLRPWAKTERLLYR